MMGWQFDVASVMRVFYGTIVVCPFGSGSHVVTCLLEVIRELSSIGTPSGRLRTGCTSHLAS